MSNINTSRRQFLKQGGALSTIGAVGAPWLFNLAAMAEASAATVPGDYKALVCVFLEGGNDACNTILPKVGDTASWSRYAVARSDIGAKKDGTDVFIKGDDYLGSSPPSPVIQSAAGAYPIHPSLPNLAAMYAAKKVSVVANVGNILGATTRTSTAVPPVLRSHNDQRAVWQSGRSNTEPKGWGGRYADRFEFSGGATPNLANYFRSVMIGDNNVFSMGDNVSAYGLTSQGAGVVPLLKQVSDGKLFGAAPQSLLLKVLRGEFKTARPNLIEQDYATVMKRALNTQDYMTTLIGTDSTAGVTMPVGMDLARDLRMVARVIRGHHTSAGRQVFFVMLRGFDTHSGQASHATLLKQLDQSLAYFQSALGPAAGKVVTFTASDFGRLLNQNGGGSDHGWGGHQFVMGEPLLSAGGGKILGRVPSYAFGGNTYTDVQMTDDGAMVPEIAIESYAGALGKWFGVTDLDTVFGKPMSNFVTSYAADGTLSGLLP